MRLEQQMTAFGVFLKNAQKIPVGLIAASYRRS